MIVFACSHCGMKFQVAEEHAGRSTSCLACKKPLLVPSSSAPQPALAPTLLQGVASVLSHVGTDVGVTLVHSNEHHGAQTPGGEAPSRSSDGERYVLLGEVGRGGMGVVVRAVDQDLHREVAIKHLLDGSDPRKKIRFVEEAQITGQLEHPNIVPVHELGIDGQQRLFFSMKMVRGRSLAQLLKELREFPRLTEKEYPLSRLLGVLSNVCHALAYAHSRGVVHRDLKPANIMLGDFGEVYVMDWGLAKVLSDPAEQSPGLADPALPRAVSVQTDRSLTEELTQEGAVLGTPLYMSPEQALGQLHALSPRSDVYAVGAILYEMLTLQPPVEREGGFQAIVQRVLNGDIIPPEKRVPERARLGKIPRELSAIALKALSHRPEDRYPSVEALRRDVEQYLDGRAVSAKEDSAWEAAVKLVRRNRGVSAALAAALLVLSVVLIVGYRINSSARARAEAALATAEKTHAAYLEQTRQAVPALIDSARLFIERRRFDRAMEQLNVALEYDPEQPVARLLRGQLLLVKKDFAGAKAELTRYLKIRPGDAEVRQLHDLCGHPRPEEPAQVLRVYRQFELIRALPVLSAELLREHGGNSLEIRKKLLEPLRNRIDAHWPGQGQKLLLDPEGLFTFTLETQKQITTVAPLEGMPLTSLLILLGPEDLSPLRGMPLRRFHLSSAPVSDLSPLRDMPLTNLELAYCPKIRDFAPLQSLKRLTVLHLRSCEIEDLSPLRGLPLTTLELNGCPVRDLSPLANLPLTRLRLDGCPNLEDLSPLRGMPLEGLSLLGSRGLRDLSPLEGKNLSWIALNPAQFGKSIEVLKTMKHLKKIQYQTGVESISADEFWKKYDAGEFKQ